MSEIVQLVITLDLSLAVANHNTPATNTAATSTTTSITDIVSTSRPRLGLMRLSALELLNKLQLCYGIRMLEVIKETDLFSSLLKMYAMYPYNDIALRYVTSVISYALDPALAKT